MAKIAIVFFVFQMINVAVDVAFLVALRLFPDQTERLFDWVTGVLERRGLIR